jgi:transposase
VQEKAILDFGDSYAITQVAENDGLYAVMRDTIPDSALVLSLVCYQLASGSAMYNFTDWVEGNIISKLFPNCMGATSQRISKLLNDLGSEEVQRKFFKQYISSFFKDKHGVLIDSTSLPSSINSSLSAFGYSADGVTQKVGCLMLVDTVSKLPLFFRSISGEIADVSTLHSTVDEVMRLGLELEQAIFDAGYFSEKNLEYLCKSNLRFLSRMPKSRKIFKELVAKTSNLESSTNAVRYGDKRAVFVKTREVNLYGHSMFAHIILDPSKKGREITQALINASENPNEAGDVDEDMKYAGIFILLSNYEINKQDVLPTYYIRQSIEQVFGFAKCNNLLPLRVHSDQSIRGYLFLVFLSIILFVQMRQKLQSNNTKNRQITVEQALLTLRNLKTKVYDKEVIPLELTKKMKEIFGALGITVPRMLGI